MSLMPLDRPQLILNPELAFKRLNRVCSDSTLSFNTGLNGCWHGPVRLSDPALLHILSSGRRLQQDEQHMQMICPPSEQLNASDIKLQAALQPFQSSHDYHGNVKNRQKERAWHTWHRAVTGCQPLFLRVRERGYLACVCCHLEAGGMPAMLYLCQQWEWTQLYQHKKIKINPIMGNHFGERAKLSDLTAMEKI